MASFRFAPGCPLLHAAASGSRQLGGALVIPGATCKQVGEQENATRVGFVRRDSSPVRLYHTQQLRRARLGHAGGRAGEPACVGFVWRNPGPIAIGGGRSLGLFAHRHQLPPLAPLKFPEEQGNNRGSSTTATAAGGGAVGFVSSARSPTASSGLSSGHLHGARTVECTVVGPAVVGPVAPAVPIVGGRSRARPGHVPQPLGSFRAVRTGPSTGASELMTSEHAAPSPPQHQVQNR